MADSTDWVSVSLHVLVDVVLYCSSTYSIDRFLMADPQATNRCSSPQKASTTSRISFLEQGKPLLIPKAFLSVSERPRARPSHHVQIGLQIPIFRYARPAMLLVIIARTLIDKNPVQLRFDFALWTARAVQ